MDWTWTGHGRAPRAEPTPKITEQIEQPPGHRGHVQFRVLARFGVDGYSFFIGDAER